MKNEMNLTADEIGQAAVGLAKSHGFEAKGVRVGFCQGKIWFDADRGNFENVKAAKRVIGDELLRLTAGSGRKLQHVGARGRRCWSLTDGYTVRMGIRIVLTERENLAMLLGSWDGLMARRPATIADLDETLAKHAAAK